MFTGGKTLAEIFGVDDDGGGEAGRRAALDAEFSLCVLKSKTGTDPRALAVVLQDVWGYGRPLINLQSRLARAKKLLHRLGLLDRASLKLRG
jgi:hypothetical protein